MYSSPLSPFLLEGMDELRKCKSELEKNNLVAAQAHAEMTLKNLRDAGSGEELDDLEVLIELIKQNKIKEAIKLINDINSKISQTIFMLEGTTVEKLKKENKYKS